MSQLVQISEIPPLRQSTEEKMSCPTFYATDQIDGQRKPGGMESARGRQIHATMSKYVSHCTLRRVPMDLSAFDQFSAGAGPHAAQILSGIRDSYKVNFEHVLGTEVKMHLDEDMQPTDTCELLESVCDDSGGAPVFEGTLDVIEIYRAEQRIQVPDYKSTPMAYDPDGPNSSTQAKRYCLMILQHFPWCQEVTFELIFVRYRNLRRHVTFARDDIPALIEAVRAARRRQATIHDDYDHGRPLEAISGSHCHYCPKLTDNTCPLAEHNEEGQHSDQELMKFLLFHQEFAAYAKKVLKNRFNATGRKLRLRDYNGRAYVFGNEETEAILYPLFEPKGAGLAYDNMGRPVMPIVEQLIDHADAYPEDVSWMRDVLLSSSKLNSALGAKKRAVLDQAISDKVVKISKSKVKISKPLENLPDEEPVDEDDEDFEGED